MHAAGMPALTTPSIVVNTSDASEQTDMQPSALSPGDSGYNSQEYQISPDEMTPVQREAFALACDYLNYKLDKAGLQWGQDRPEEYHAYDASPDAKCRAMRRMCDEFEFRLAENYANMLANLDISSEVLAHSTFLQVASEVFCDGEFRWGRVAALYVFAGSLAIECFGRNLSSVTKQIPSWLSVFVEQYLQDYILENGDWDGFVEFAETRALRQPEASHSTFKKVMTGVGLACGALGVVTLGAILART